MESLHSGPLYIHRIQKINRTKGHWFFKSLSPTRLRLQESNSHVYLVDNISNIQQSA
jgi:hypothetical protein